MTTHLEVFRDGNWVEPESVREFDYMMSIDNRPTVSIAGHEIREPWRIYRDGVLVSEGNVNVIEQ